MPIFEIHLPLFIDTSHQTSARINLLLHSGNRDLYLVQNRSANQRFARLAPMFFQEVITRQSDRNPDHLIIVKAFHL